jgi:hypothetical protein
LLVTVHTPDAGFGEFLLGLARDLDWSEEGVVHGRRVVPLLRWATVVAAFHEKGLPGLIDLIQRDNMPARFVFAVLEEIKSVESVQAVLEILGDTRRNPGSEMELANRAATTINLLLSFDGRPELPNEMETEVREFLHALLRLDLSELDRASAVLALRGVGDETSLELIKNFKFDGAWADTVSTTRRSICRRVKGGRY